MIPTQQVQATRYVAMDVHRDYALVGAMNAQRQVVLQPVRVSLEKLAGWAVEHLNKQDAVVIESTSNAFHLHDVILPHVGWVQIANANAVKWIGHATVKTDAADTLKLATLLAAGLIPCVWVPPRDIRDLRGLVAHRARLIKERTQVRNRLHAVLHRNAIMLPEGDPFSGEHRQWWATLKLSSMEALRIRQDLQLLNALHPLIKEAETELLLRSVDPVWKPTVTLLMQQPGMGVLTCMLLIAAIGDITRFPGAKQLVGYAGLGTSVHDSGQTHKHGRITKHGRCELRHAMVEAAWVAVQHNAVWKAQFERMKCRMPPAKAIVAIARKLLERVWHIWSNSSVDRDVTPLAIAKKMRSWSVGLRAAGRLGKSNGQFIRDRLDELRIGQDISEIPSGKSNRFRLPVSALS